MRKTCEACGNDAVVTVCWLVSTMGTSPRVQKCSKASALCQDCVGTICSRTDVSGSVFLRQRLADAYTAASAQSRVPSLAGEVGDVSLFRSLGMSATSRQTANAEAAL